MAKVCILGGGSWGIGLSVVLHKNGHEVTVWSAVPAEIQMLQIKRMNKMLPGVKLPEDMIFTTDDKQATEGKDLLVMAVASSYTRSTAHRISPLVAQGQKIVSVSKGIEEYQKSKDGALLIITHSTRILESLHVDKTHVLVDGRLVAEGDGSLVDEINENGFEQFIASANEKGEND